MIVDIKTGKLVERDPKDDPLFITRHHWNELMDYLHTVEARLNRLEVPITKRGWRLWNRD